MWLEGFAQLGRSGRKHVFFAQGAKKKVFGGKFRTKNSDRPYAGMDDNSPFRQFLGYEYKKTCFAQDLALSQASGLMHHCHT
jgi:hypothetical protein